MRGGGVSATGRGNASASKRRYTGYMVEGTAKQELLRAIERLPDDATLDDVAQLVKMHQLLAQGRADSAAGRKFTSDQLRERYGIPLEG